MPADLIYDLTIVGSANGKQFSNVLHYKQISATPGGAAPANDAGELVNAANADLVAEWAAIMPIGYDIEGTYARQAIPGDAVVYPAFQVEGVGGDRTGETWQGGSGPLVMLGPATLSTDVSQRGRSYIPIMNEEDWDGNVLSPAYVADIVAAFENIFIITSTNAVEFRLVTFSKQEYLAASTYEWEVEVVRVSSKVARQTRRLKRF